MEETLLTTQLIYLQTLYAIVCDSEEPDTIRRAFAALTSTEAGLDYLRINPITV